MIIAIDGPSASGKGTLAKKLARHFNFAYLNTGAIYRLVAFRVLQQGFDANNIDLEIPNLVANITELDLEKEELFSEETGVIASIIAKNQQLRDALFKFQKDFIQNSVVNYGGCVTDGRDTTTVICPDADFKFFIQADVEIRAKRRFEQLQKKGDDVNYEEILGQLKKRDENDMNRSNSPLKIADSAIIIDNGNLSIEEGFELALKHINSPTPFRA